MGRSAWNGGLNPPGLIVERQSLVGSVVEVWCRVAEAVGLCPDCGTPSSSCHSRYVRTLSDLPISGAVVKLRLSVRRFRCKQHACGRKTFSEALAPDIEVEQDDADGVEVRAQHHHRPVAADRHRRPLLQRGEHGCPLLEADRHHHTTGHPTIADGEQPAPHQPVDRHRGERLRPRHLERLALARR